MRGLRILVVDDEQDYCNVMKVILNAKGHQTALCTSGADALSLLSKNTYDLVITDLIMPEMDGNQLLHEIKNRYPDTEVMMMTAYGTIENAVGAMREGAYSYVTKGGNPEELVREIEKLQSMLELKRENELLKEKVAHVDVMLDSKSPGFLEMLSIAKKAAASDTNVLILGESGVGKEVIAQYIHRNSLRKNKQFMDLNCHAIAETVLESELFGHEKGSFTGALHRRIGRIEAADQGTLFLDEIGDIPLTMQAKLLKTIENKKIYRMGSNEELEVDFRLVTATNKNLEIEMEEGRFREDFFYRISTIVINIPPLRKRQEDIPLLIDYFFKRSQNEMKKPIHRIDPDVMDFLKNYHYPGNVRELKNIIERLVVLSEDGVVQKEALPTFSQRSKPENQASIQDERGLKEIRRETEKNHIESVLRRHNNNMTKAAEVLGITRRQLFNKISEYNLEK
ncbi:sigma-54-dependent Fis family transcriptional regulator [Clostridiales bacterium BAD-6]|uniref:Stage 0 sporulation protein A homolog n=2 Tax=Sinanaerobacter chloroacetimidivorans TaxID=2818044 RepID=A0A8J7W253_9FIRM|nr:sigma-54-dependent Fis family transcriptional regulator [Sinanaerobacter chloroacetimidivorans]